MVHPRLSRFLALVVLLLWTAPGVAASATALHVALDHHGAEDAEHAREIAEMVHAATHGHHHDVTASEHGHEASLRAAVSVPKPVAVVVVAAPSCLASSAAGERPLAESGLRRGPPRALFTTHCSLLL